MFFIQSETCRRRNQMLARRNPFSLHRQVDDGCKGGPWRLTRRWKLWIHYLAASMPRVDIGRALQASSVHYLMNIISTCEHLSKINSENNLFYINFWNSSHSFSGSPCPDANPNCSIFSRPDKGSRNRHVKPVVSSWGGPSNLKKKVLRPRRLCQHVRSSRTSFHRPRALVVRLESLRWLLCMF